MDPSVPEQVVGSTVVPNDISGGFRTILSSVLD